nr:FimV/HubP family polar landmark protein [Thermomonas flagellata]
MALGLGQIQVKSQRNQPLLAEIPIISVTPGELEALQARLASPETFRRVGLAPPSGAAADLQFSLGQDGRGRPVIRVTTLQPLEQPLLNFLIEVEWGQGRLVREYSVALDTPQAAAAALQPAIQPALAADAPVVQRPLPEAPAAPSSPPSSEASTAAAPAAGAPAPAASAAPPPAASPLPAQYGPVKHGETLAVIAQRLRLAAGNRLDQAMLALLRANPDAFLGDDINRLRQGAVLRIPSAADIAAIPPEEAAQVVREQLRQWRQARRAVAQPTAATGTHSAAAGSARAVPTPATAAKPTGPVPAPAATPAAAAPRRAEARLQIVPPADGRPATATKTGNSAKGEGSMLQQELQRRDEEIAAKRAEIDELKDRVAALEKLKQEQARLLALKDSELAAAQQKLAQAASAPTPAQPAAPPAPAQPASHAAWWWGGAGLLAAIVLAWLLLRRRAPASPPPRRRLFDSDALAASLRTAAPAAPAPAPADAAPPWHAPAASPADAVPPSVPESPAAAEDPAAPAAASAEHRFKLARAFLDIGDEHSARQLLTELLHDADPAAREDAARLLRELG